MKKQTSGKLNNSPVVQKFITHKFVVEGTGVWYSIQASFYYPHMTYKEKETSISSNSKEHESKGRFPWGVVNQTTLEKPTILSNVY